MDCRQATWPAGEAGSAACEPCSQHLPAGVMRLIAVGRRLRSNCAGHRRAIAASPFQHQRNRGRAEAASRAAARQEWQPSSTTSRLPSKKHHKRISFAQQESKQSLVQRAGQVASLHRLTDVMSQGRKRGNLLGAVRTPSEEELEASSPAWPGVVRRTCWSATCRSRTEKKGRTRRARTAV